MPDYSLKVIDELQATYKLIGMKRTIAALQHARLTGDPIELHISFITDLVCGSFSTTVEKIKEGRDRNETTYAKGFIVYYLRTEFDIDWKQLKELLDRDQSNLYRWSKLIKQLDVRLAPHKPYCEKKEFFDQKIKLYKQQLKK